MIVRPGMSTPLRALKLRATVGIGIVDLDDCPFHPLAIGVRLETAHVVDDLGGPVGHALGRLLDVGRPEVSPRRLVMPAGF